MEEDWLPKGVDPKGVPPIAEPYVGFPVAMPFGPEPPLKLKKLPFVFPGIAGVGKPE